MIIFNKLAVMTIAGLVLGIIPSTTLSYGHSGQTHTPSTTTTTQVPKQNPSPLTLLDDYALRSNHPTQLGGFFVRQYQMFERGEEVKKLQIKVGAIPDGIYGKRTRKKHIEAIGGHSEALALWYPQYSIEEAVSSGYTLGELINFFFKPSDRQWATAVAFCESSGKPHHYTSTAISDALAIGWFQHLIRYWDKRSSHYFEEASPFDPIANVAIASWLYYFGGGERHWFPSKACWDKLLK
jgi:hypothetical protein